jgi:hypothetical protein
MPLAQRIPSTVDAAAPRAPAPSVPRPLRASVPALPPAQAAPEPRARASRLGPLDRRMRDRAESRQLAAFVAGCAGVLAAPDRELILAVYARGERPASLARLMGVSPFVLRRRLREIVRRVCTPEFQYVLRTRDAWPARLRRVGEAVVLEGRTLREASANLALTYHQIRTATAGVRSLMSAALAAAGAGRTPNDTLASLLGATRANTARTEPADAAAGRDDGGAQ